MNLWLCFVETSNTGSFDIGMVAHTIGIRDGNGGKVKLSPYLTNQALRHEGVWGSGCIDSNFFDLNTSWR
jgi:hypothetical protein